jgi:phosphatidate cytidylyltransferase
VLLTRVLSALVLAPPFLYCAWRGGAWFFVLAAALSIVGLKEYFDLLARAGHASQQALGYAWTAAIYAGVWCAGTDGVLAALALVPNLVILKYLATPAIDGAVHESSRTFYGVVAFSMPLAFLVLLRGMEPGGLALLMILLLLVWIQDSAAYFWGRALGRHKLSEHLSPKKTWEGAVLGLVTALALVWAGSTWWLARPPGGALMAGLALTCVSAQLGDLNESLLKRNVAAKDSGTLIPGHGGILDRFDSFTFAAPVMYYVARAVEWR